MINMSGASFQHGGGDDPSNLPSFAPAMIPSTSNSTPTPTPSYNTEIATFNGAQANSASGSGREGSYVPQFSAATEMILRRMRGEPTGEFDPSSSPNVDGWEEAKAKVMMGMKTSMNMDMGPMPQSAGRRGSTQRNAASRAAASRAASRRASSTPGPSGPTMGGATSTASTPVPTASTSVPKTTGRSTPTNRSTPSGTPRSTRGGRGSATRGRGRGGRGVGKRKRQAEEEIESESAEESDNMSKLGDDSSDGDGDSIANMPSMTSSGRQIQKPKTFVPEVVEGPPRKRVAAPKKIQDQALCKRCGRGHSPQSNMIVFCDGCNMGWHQMCHDPVVSDDVVKDESLEWFCVECTAQREKKSKPSKTEPVQTQPALLGGAQAGTVGVGQQEKAAAQGQRTFVEQQQQQQPRVETSGGVSGIGKTTEEKRAYLSALPHAQLVALLLHATTVHPDLPIFPPTPQHVLASQPTVSYPNSVYASQNPQHMGGGAVNQYANPRFQNQQTQQGDRRINVHPQQPFPPSAASGLFSRAEANPAAPINFIRKIPGGGNANVNGVIMASVENGGSNGFVQGNCGQQATNLFLPPQHQGFRAINAIPSPAVGGFINPHSHPINNAISNHGLFINSTSALPNPELKTSGEDGQSSRESTPASPPYPRPGNGLMRKLPPDDQDLEWLEDVGDYEAFSHVVYDSEGRGERIEEDGVPVVGGVGTSLSGMGAGGVLEMRVSVGMGGAA